MVGVSGQSKPPSDLRLKLSSPYPESSPILSHLLKKLKSDGCLHSVAVPGDLWLSTCGKLLSAGTVPGCWNSRKAAGKCLLSSACEMLSILLLFNVIYAASHLPNLLCSSADPIQSPLGTNQPWWHFLHAWRKMSVLLWRVIRLKCTARLTIYLVGMTR